MSKTLKFKAFCFEAYKAEHNLNGYETMELFKKYGVLEFIEICYEPLHSQGRDYIVSDIDIYINSRKKTG